MSELQIIGPQETLDTFRKDCPLQIDFLSCIDTFNAFRISENIW